MKNTNNTSNEHKITLDRPAIFQVKITGEPSENWSDWIDQVEITSESDFSGNVITRLTGQFDQAALHGLLRRLYYLGYPLISVNCIGEKKSNELHR